MNSDQSRFQPSKSVLLVDTYMTHFIKIGGMLVIAAVMGIFVFIFWKTAPLFSGAKVTAADTIELPGSEAVAGIILDEWSEMPAIISTNGDVSIFPRGKSKSKPVNWKFSENVGDSEITAIVVQARGQRIVAGTKQGSVSVAELSYKPAFNDDNERIIEAQPKVLGTWKTGLETPIERATYYDSESRKVIAALQSDENGQQRLTTIALKQKRTLLGVGKVVVDRIDDLTPLIDGTIAKFEIGADAELVAVATTDGTIHYLRIDGDKPERIQTFRPFGAGEISEMQFLLADKTLILCDTSGKMVGYSLLMPAEDAGIQFVHTKTFDELPGVATVFAASERNRSFVVAVGSHATLRYGTTTSTRWSGKLPFTAEHVALSRKFDTIAFLSEERHMHFYDLADKHPEAGWQAFFGKIWYEGASRPEWTWQSTGGSDSFEPKLSMIPLIFGSLKGTLYAMIFALPLALLAAIYCSQFQHPAYKTVVKPTMEIMASLPSVVLGFLGALWLAPLIEDQVPAVLAFLIILPTAAMAFGYVWTRLPAQVRVICKPGREFIFALPIVLISFAAAYLTGPILEAMLFTVPGPDDTQVADFRLWWATISGSNFEQRNALVVGFMMGFAVIPIIFTIAEDALSNVPNALKSASLALGASRWQTAIRIILPTASPGIFSGVMIGIGRAVGETMIVLMATGNTPITEWSIFNGMRTLAANIAVELPEAPVDGTLFRSLYMGALILFCMTFVLNTCAEMLRRHLRNKYKTV